MGEYPNLLTQFNLMQLVVTACSNDFSRSACSNNFSRSLESFTTFEHTHGWRSILENQTDPLDAHLFDWDLQYR
jgi:hypothetical protein